MLLLFVLAVVIPIRNINWSYCQFERSREPLLHLDCARCDKKGLDFYMCLSGIIIIIAVVLNETAETIIINEEAINETAEVINASWGAISINRAGINESW